MKITIIGAGNMGSAIARGFIHSGTIEAAQITLTDPHKPSLTTIQQEFPALHTDPHNASAVKNADIVILAVKPWLANSVAREIATQITPQTIVVSIAAGVTLQELSNELAAATQRIIRLIPNTAIAIQQSMTVMAANPSTDDQATHTVAELFGTLGEVMIINESYFPAATAVGSCGTAFALRYLRAAMEGAIELGLTATDAKKMIIQTVIGAMQMVRTNDSHPEAEIDKVTTPGGITIKGLNKMEQEGFTNSVIEGLKACIK